MVEEQRKFFYSDCHSTISGVKDKSRETCQSIRKDKKHILLSTKRFRSEKYINIPPEDYSTERVQQTARSLHKKGESTRENLKFLRNAFATSSEFVTAFLDIENALFSLVGYLTGTDTDLQLEAAWCITNIAANDNDNILVVAKATTAYLLTFLCGGSVLLQDQSAWALGNMAADSVDVRQILKDQGIVEPLVNLVKSDVDGVVQSALFAICNLCRSQEMFVPDFASSNLIDVIKKKLSDSNTDLNIVGEIAWVLTHFTFNATYCGFLMKNNFNIFISEWICKVRPHQQDYLFVTTPLLRCLGNLLNFADGNQLAGIFVHSNNMLLHSLNSQLASNRRYLIKECLWVLSNVFATDFFHALEGFNEIIDILFPSICKHLSSAYEIRKQAAVCICNLTSKSSDYCLCLCTSKNVVTSFIEFLKIPDNDLVWLALRYFELLLDRSVDGYQTFLQCDGPSYLEATEFHENTDIRNKAIEILEKNYEKDDSDIEDVQGNVT